VRTKDSRLWTYDAFLLALCAGIAWLLPWAGAWPSWPLVLGFAALQLLVWHYAFAAPGLGMLSMERMPQVAALCLLPMPKAALLIALPALLFPAVNRRYRQGSWVVGLQRGVHNACMIFLMGVAAGAAYAALGGTVPFAGLDARGLFALAAMAGVLQLVNNAMIVAFYALEGRDVRRLLNARYLLLDLAFVPFGVLLALITNRAGTDALALFLLLVMLMVLSLHRLETSRGAIATRLENLDAASRCAARAPARAAWTACSRASSGASRRCSSSASPTSPCTTRCATSSTCASSRSGTNASRRRTGRCRRAWRGWCSRAASRC
jgi:hypothetical protein